jgi:hypothetical protein
MLAALAVTTAPVMYGDAVDSLTLVPVGPNTVFTIAGTYAPGTPTTTFSSSNTAYSLTFTLPTTPSPLDFSDPIGAFGLGTSATLNGIIFPNSQAVFFEQSLGGGLAVCLSQVCNPNSPVSPEWDILGNQLFVGSVDAPTFVSGAANFDPVQSSYNITASVPEPATLTFGGIGIGVCAFMRWRRRLTK